MSVAPGPREPRRPAETPAEVAALRGRIMASPSYAQVEDDRELLRLPEMRPVRLMLELQKPEMALEAAGVRSTIVVFGGTAIVAEAAAALRLEQAQLAAAAHPHDARLARRVARAQRVREKTGYYDAARAFAALVSTRCQCDGERDYVIVTGGGPGIMEAANLGAYETGRLSIGLNITLPAEQEPNPYITPELCFRFRYFAMRKMHFLLRAKALLVFPGGFGTLDELFDALTLRQTQRMQAIPIIMYGQEYWRQVLNFQFLADEGMIDDQHLELIQFAESPEQAWELICQFHGHGSAAPSHAN